MKKMPIAKVLKMCVCEQCPSFVECHDGEGYCFKGKSKCINEMRGCICGGCPVHKEAELKSGYYCLRGKEK